jgi:hypothetical protein
VNELVALAQSVPQPALADAFRHDITAKELAVTACAAHHPLPPTETEFLRKQTSVLRARLHRYGYRI